MWGYPLLWNILHKKGFELDPNPNTKLPHEAYLLLVKEYSTDISAKKESEKLVLKDLHRKKETVSIDDFSEKTEAEESEKDDEILVKDSSGLNKSVDVTPDIKKPDIKPVGKVEPEKTEKPKAAPKKEEADQRNLQEKLPNPKKRIRKRLPLLKKSPKLKNPANPE